MGVIVLTEEPTSVLASLYNCLGELPGVEVVSIRDYSNDTDGLIKRLSEADVVHYTYWNHYFTSPSHINGKSVVSVHHLVDRRWTQFLTMARRVPIDAVVVSDAMRVCRFGEAGIPVDLIEYWVDGEAHPWRQIRMNKSFTVGILGRDWDDYSYKRFDVIREAVALAGAKLLDGGINLRDKFVFDDINEFYDNIDLYVHASYIDGGPMPALEAMSRGIPVVSTPCGMMAKWLKDARYGRFTTGTVADIADNIRHMMTHERPNATLSQVDRAYLCNNTRWLEQHEAVYRKVMA